MKTGGPSGKELRRQSNKASYTGFNVFKNNWKDDFNVKY